MLSRIHLRNLLGIKATISQILRQLFYQLLVGRFKMLLMAATWIIMLRRLAKSFHLDRQTYFFGGTRCHKGQNERNKQWSYNTYNISWTLNVTHPILLARIELPEERNWGKLLIIIQWPIQDIVIRIESLKTWGRTSLMARIGVRPLVSEAKIQYGTYCYYLYDA